jgi:hypothetical protein
MRKELLLLLVPALVLARSTAQADDPDAVSRIQGRLAGSAGVSPADRVLDFGESLLDSPYIVSPLGEGPLGRYDRNPLYRFDGFDCMTFVETLTALSISDSWDGFKTALNGIRYKDGEISFVARNHFADLDWIPNNVRAGIFRDITESVAPGRTLVARAVVDKRAWYAAMTTARLQTPELSGDEKQKLLVELHNEGLRFSLETAAVPYIPLTALFGPGGDGLFDRIPSGSVVNIVRPNWDLVAAIGTHLNISHQGFAVRKNGVLYFLQDSSSLKKVVMVPMTEYLRPFLESPTIKGINVLEIGRRP